MELYFSKRFEVVICCNILFQMKPKLLRNVLRNNIPLCLRTEVVCTVASLKVVENLSNNKELWIKISIQKIDMLKIKLYMNAQIYINICHI